MVVEVPVEVEDDWLLYRMRLASRRVAWTTVSWPLGRAGVGDEGYREPGAARVVVLVGA